MENLTGKNARPTQKQSCKNLHRQDRLCHLLDGLGLRNVSEKSEDAAVELGRLEAQGGGVERAGNFPELLGAASGGVNAPRVAAGERFVLFITDEQHGKRARGDCFFWRNFGDGKTS